jgi:methylglutaconyl-CoA hydratase
MIKDFMPVLNQVELDIDIAHFTEKLASYNGGFSPNEKNNLGRNDDWDTLLLKRAAVSELVLSDFTKKH